MQGIKLGNLIRQSRIRKEISAKQLSRGLCSQAALAYYEKGSTFRTVCSFSALCSGWEYR